MLCHRLPLRNSRQDGIRHGRPQLGYRTGTAPHQNTVSCGRGKAWPTKRYSDSKPENNNSMKTIEHLYITQI